MKALKHLVFVGLLGCGNTSVAFPGDDGGIGGNGGAASSSSNSTVVSSGVASSSGSGGSTGTGGEAAGGAGSCIPVSCDALSCGIISDHCGGMLDCGGCPDQVDGYPSICLIGLCQPFNNTIFSSECAEVCGHMNDDAWNNCLSECQNNGCTVDQSCTNCNFLFSAEPDCLPCLHMNFPGQSCGG